MSEELYEEQTKQMNKLLENIKEKLPTLEAHLNKVSSHWHYEDLIYRYYHHSYKVFYIQQETKDMVEAMIELSPNDKGLDSKFMEIYEDGIGKEFEQKHNKEWRETCAPMVEAFLHAKYFLEMIVKYGKEYDEAPDLLH
jgi:hypothetical protein